MKVIRSLRGDHNFRKLRRAPSVYNRYLSLRYLSYESSRPEILLAIITSKKVGKAVVRNRLRRRLREALRSLLLPALADHSPNPAQTLEVFHQVRGQQTPMAGVRQQSLVLMIIAQPQAVNLDYWLLRSELLTLLKKGRLL